MTKITFAAHCRRRPIDDEIIVDFGKREISRWRTTVYLPPTPFRLAAVLITASGRKYFDHHELADAVFGDRADGGPESIIKRIRVDSAVVKRALWPVGMLLSTEKWTKHILVLDRPATAAEIVAHTRKNSGHTGRLWRAVVQTEARP